MLRSIIFLGCVAMILSGLGGAAVLQAEDWPPDLAGTLVEQEEGYVVPSFSSGEANWLVDRLRAVSHAASFSASANQPPYIMLAGYYDTDVTYADGGTFKLIAYVMDPDGPQDVARVELYYNATPTGVLMADDGNNGDFGAGDQVFGLLFEIGPNVLPAGSYTLEIVATDQSGNVSDMWPYLTVHP